ncbi:MAG: IS21 family transposase [Candidatus Cloacimonetes bacterium]|nr:IS21 family transposase [Candidatus Cloacimonadota bacterium]
MYHTIQTLKTLGKSQREIAAELRISKSTVNKYCKLSETEGETGCCRRAGSSLFAVAEDYVRQRLLQYPNLRASRLYYDVLKAYPEIKGKPRAFRNFVRKLKDTLPAPQSRVFSIVETEAGKQVQVDIGEMRVDCSFGGQFKVYFCCFVLSFSRYLFVHCQTKPYNTEDFIEAHRQSFRYMEGLAAEYVYDQTKLVAISERYREVLFNETFHQFAMKSGFYPHVCEGYDPQSKGKVERSVAEVKHGFLYGNKFADLAEVRNQIGEWLSRFNQRVHSTIKQQPQMVWSEEKKLFKPIPEHLVCPQTRKADKTGVICFEGNKYSVPMNFQNRQVIVEKTDGFLNISDPLNGKIIAAHSIPKGKGNLILNNNHYRDFIQELKDLKADATALLAEYDPEAKIINRLIQDNPKIPRDQLRAICKLARHYDKHIWHEAVPVICGLHTTRATKIEAILRDIEYRQRVKAARQHHPPQPVAGSVLQRSLNAYMEVLKNDRKY